MSDKFLANQTMTNGEDKKMIFISFLKYISGAMREETDENCSAHSQLAPLPSHIRQTKTGSN